MLIGATFGSYRVIEKLGAGGMGEVYRAHDSALQREVALKILPALASHDPTKDERLERFAREARALAALNHPHIGAIYGLESHVVAEAGTTPVTALVLELIEGQTLAERIERGPLSIAEATRLAGQIAGALEAAHEKSIVHRDLKPANVKVTANGVVKVLDFGLAKTIAGPEQAGDGPTAMVTRQGAVVGTPAYMSPEQVRGQDVDKRTDVWAFGCVFYEMLTGHRVFAGSTWSDCMAAVLDREPDWSLLPPGTPSEIRVLLGRCLQKDRARRLRDIGDAQLVLEEPAVPSAVAPASVAPRRSLATIAIVALTAAALGGVVIWLARRSAPARVPAPMRVEIVPSPEDPINVATTTSTLAISPDGQTLAWASDRHRDRNSGGPLIVRDIDELLPRRVEGAAQVRDPFFSPDGQWIAFYNNPQGLMKIPAAGGTPSVILPYTGAAFRGASWAGDGRIVYSTVDAETGLMHVSDTGGTATVLTKPDKERGEADHVLPSVLPGGRGILFTILDAAANTQRVAVLDPRDQSKKVLIDDASNAHYIDAGYLVYVTTGSVVAVRFDLDRLAVQGEPVTLARDVLMGTSVGAYYAVSQTGTLAYVPATATPDAPRTLVWVDRTGAETPVKVPPRPYQTVRLSPDGQRVAVWIGDEHRDVWTLDLQRLALTRITTDPGMDWAPTWTPDGQHVVFSRRDGAGSNLYRQAADGTGAAERLTQGIATFVPRSITADGGYLIGHSSIPRTWSLLALPLAKAGPPEPLVISPPASRYLPAFSPNGRFVAYTSDEGGGMEVFVRPFPEVHAGRWQVSIGGGNLATWARSGRELFYLDASNRLTTVSVDTTAAALRPGPPLRLLQSSYYAGSFDVSPDGQRFLMIKEDPAARPPNTPIVLVMNLLESLAAKTQER